MLDEHKLAINILICIIMNILGNKQKWKVNNNCVPWAFLSHGKFLFASSTKRLFRFSL